MVVVALLADPTHEWLSHPVFSGAFGLSALHLVGEGPDLTDPVQYSLGLGLQVALGHFSGQLAALLQLG